MTQVVVEAFVGAAPATLYEWVSDITRMGRWSPETTECRWIGDASVAAPGARFRGRNRSGWRRWTTTCTVIEAEPGRCFSFRVRFGPFQMARWTYDFFPEAEGCRVRETWTEMRPRWIVALDSRVMAIDDRATHNRSGMAATLAALRQHADGDRPCV